MKILVTDLDKAFPGGHYLKPSSRSNSLNSAGRDYFQACKFLVENHNTVGPLFYVVLPTMHQTLELLAKAVAYRVDPNFEPKKYSHRVRDIVNDYAALFPFFLVISTDPEMQLLLEGLEKAYLGVRYGQCAISYDGEAFALFVQIAEGLGATR